MAIASLAASGCSTRCRGPGCEDDFERSTIARLPGPTLLAGEVDIDDARDGRLLGLPQDGVGWALDAIEGQLLLGTPDGRSVVRVAPPVDDTPLAPLATFTVDTPGFGASVQAMATADGFDLWVGSPDHDEARGGLWRFPDAHAAPAFGAEPDLLVTPSSPADRLGDQIVRCGDLTGDGRDDLVVTIPWFQPPANWPVADPSAVPSLAGAVAVLHSESLRGASGEVRPWDVGTLYWGAEVGAAAGAGVHCRTDLDGDGRPDLVVGAPHAADQDGEVYLLTSSPLPASGALPEVAWRTLRAPRPGSWFGEAVDAFVFADQPTLFVAGPGSLEGRGSVWLYRAGGLANAAPVPNATYDNANTDPDHVGRSLAHGDLDGDGRLELLIGAPDLRLDSRTYGVGQLWVFGPDQDLGAPLATAQGIVTDTQPFRRIGQEVLVSDLDGDGVDEAYLATQVR